MPYNHPNKVVLRKGRSRSLRKIFNLWPLVAWVGAIFLAIWAYKQGVVFRRMNGAVDVYQENVSPIEDGNLEKLGDGIFRGAPVKEGQIVAYMRSTQLDEQILMVKHEIETSRVERLRDYASDILKIESELREIEGDLASAQAEAEATQKEIDGMVDRMKKMGLTSEAQQMAITGPMVSDFNIKIAKYSALVKVRTIDKGKVENDRDRLIQERDALANEKDLGKVAERDQATELAQLMQKERFLILRATRDGVIDRILKEPGEYVKAGDGVLKIVGGPSQIIGFLSQDQIDAIKKDKEVWITPTSDRTKIYNSKVLFLAPRMNTLPDSTGPSANSRLFGRDVICEYPKESGLLPGQTVIIWIEPPGDIPILNRLIRNDDIGGGK